MLSGLKLANSKSNLVDRLLRLLWLFSMFISTAVVMVPFPSNLAEITSTRRKFPLEWTSTTWGLRWYKMVELAQMITKCKSSWKKWQRWNKWHNSTKTTSSSSISTWYKRTKKISNHEYIFLSLRGEHYLTPGDGNNNPIKIKYPEVCWVDLSLY